MNIFIAYSLMIVIFILLLVYISYYYASCNSYGRNCAIYLTLLVILVLLWIIFIYMYYERNKIENKRIFLLFPIFALFVIYITFEKTIVDKEYKHTLFVLGLSEGLLLLILIAFLILDNKCDCN